MSVGTNLHRIRLASQARQDMPFLFLIIITMVAIGLFIQYDRMTKGSREIRTKAFTQTATGIRIEAEEMTLSGAVTKDPTNTFIQF